MSYRAVITGIGLVTPAGSTLAKFQDAIFSGRSGITLLENAEQLRCRTKAGGLVKDCGSDTFFNAKERARLDRASQFAVRAADAALHDASLMNGGGVARVDGGEDLAIIIGTGIGCIQTCENSYRQYFADHYRNAVSVPMAMAHAPAAQISMRYGLHGYSSTVSTACSSGAVAIGAALREVRSGTSKRVLAGGVDASLTEAQLDIWGALKVLTNGSDEPARLMKPFSKNRDGFVMGEGAVIVVLEELQSALTRGVHIYAEIVGFGSSSDGYHITAPSVDGEVLAMKRALSMAQVAADQVDYINAHGTATPLNDRTETEAIKKVFERRDIPVSSIKPITGHMIGASGAAECVALALTLANGMIPPTINYEEEDPDCDLDYVTEGQRPYDMEYGVSNSFGFGGNNAVLVARKWRGDGEP
jgi:3-oxoacyl-[acyl-carrier-protein] synthase II